jgi:hypothetical protein
VSIEKRGEKDTGTFLVAFSAFGAIFALFCAKFSIDFTFSTPPLNFLP